MAWWHLHPDVIVWTAFFLGAYLYALRRVGGPRDLKPTRAQVTWYSLGVLAFYVGAGTPIHDLAEQRLFTIHMIQHMLFTLIAPPLMLMGIPAWLVAPALGRPRALAALRFLCKPFLALMIFNTLTLITHFPVVVDATLNHHWLHFVVHLLLMSTAALMWMPALSPTPLLPRLSPPVQMIYLFLQSLVPTVLASFITFSSSAWYEFYVNAPRTWGWSAIHDQQIAGLIMKLGGGAILWFVISIVFFRWVSGEERRSRHQPVTWEEVEGELDRMGLTKSGAHQS